MTARHQRCLAAIAGRKVDRVPTYLPGMACEVASRLLGRLAHSGTGSLHYAEAVAWAKGDAAHEEFVQRLFQDLCDLHRLLDLDVFRMPWRISERPTKQIDERTFLYGQEDGYHQVFRYAPEAGDFARIDSGQAGEGDFEEMIRRRVEVDEAAVERGELDRVSVPAAHKDLCRRFGEEFFVVFNGGTIGLGMDAEPLMLLATTPDLVRRWVMLQARWAVAQAKALRRENLPAVLIGGGDLAGNAGPVYSPHAFRRVMLPALQHAMEEMAKVGAHYIFRSDGNLWPIADMIFGEARCPGFGEVDRDAGMTMGAIRARFPQLVCWGNMSVNKLGSHSAEWTREESRRIIAESGGTGYFHGPSNAVMQGTPAENVEAMFSVR